MQSVALYDMSRKTCFDMIPYGSHFLVCPKVYILARHCDLSQEKSAVAVS